MPPSLSAYNSPEPEAWSSDDESAASETAQNQEAQDQAAHVQPAQGQPAQGQAAHGQAAGQHPFAGNGQAMVLTNWDPFDFDSDDIDTDLDGYLSFDSWDSESDMDRDPYDSDHFDPFWIAEYENHCLLPHESEPEDDPYDDLDDDASIEAEEEGITKEEIMQWNEEIREEHRQTRMHGRPTTALMKATWSMLRRDGLMPKLTPPPPPPPTRGLTINLSVRPPAPVVRNGTNFLSLSAEIRNIIYKLALLTPKAIVWGIIFRHDLPDYLGIFLTDTWCPAILRANKQVHTEAAAILYGANMFSFWNYKPQDTNATRTLMDKLVERIGKRNAASIRTVAIPFPFYRKPSEHISSVPSACRMGCVNHKHFLPNCRLGNCRHLRRMEDRLPGLSSLVVVSQCSSTKQWTDTMNAKIRKELSNNSTAVDVMCKSGFEEFYGDITLHIPNYYLRENWRDLADVWNEDIHQGDRFIPRPPASRGSKPVTWWPWEGGGEWKYLVMT